MLQPCRGRVRGCACTYELQPRKHHGGGARRAWRACTWATGGWRRKTATETRHATATAMLRGMRCIRGDTLATLVTMVRARVWSGSSPTRRPTGGGLTVALEGAGPRKCFPPSASAPRRQGRRHGPGCDMAARAQSGTDRLRVEGVGRAIASAKRARGTSAKQSIEKV